MHWKRYAQRTLVALLLLPGLYLILSTGGLSVTVLSFVLQTLCWQEYISLRPALLTTLSPSTTHTTNTHNVVRASQLCSFICTAIAYFRSHQPLAFAPILVIFATLVVPFIDIVQPNLVLRRLSSAANTKAKDQLPSQFIATAVDVMILTSFVAGLTSIIPLNARVNNNDEDIGLSLTVFGFLAPWVADTAALFVGSRFGKRHVVPNLSPNKTLEGFMAMIPGAVLVAVVLKFIGELYGCRVLAFYRNYSLLYVCYLATMAAIWGAVGDLLESAMKRLANVKDTGTLFGPHGGVIDRIDSILPVMLLLNLLI